MTRWLAAARAPQTRLTKPTELTNPQSSEVLSVLSVLSGHPEVMLDLWEERAAVREYEGEEPRVQAEHNAARAMGLTLEEIYALRSATRPD
ncbi:hypothetical protein [Thioclava atlantica]|uniref:hypothetical protein n=1 Tax=Thioclava atlantica TaxID=1317124 RepID=UPI0012DFEA68|nr:hypothetical protein [Thioclava atlantica]